MRWKAGNMVYWKTWDGEKMFTACMYIDCTSCLPVNLFLCTNGVFSAGVIVWLFRSFYIDSQRVCTTSTSRVRRHGLRRPLVDRYTTFQTGSHQERIAPGTRYIVTIRWRHSDRSIAAATPVGRIFSSPLYSPHARRPAGRSARLCRSPRPPAHE